MISSKDTALPYAALKGNVEPAQIEMEQLPGRADPGSVETGPHQYEGIKLQ